MDEHGELPYQVLRGEHKEFSQRRPDPQSRSGWRWSLDGVRRILYHLPELLAAPPSAAIWVAEGEKDVHALEAAGEIATCNPGGALTGEGAKRWQPEWSQALAGRDVLIVADKDPAGRVHATHVVKEIAPVTRFLWVVEARTGNDSADHLAAGHTVAEFVWWLR